MIQCLLSVIDVYRNYKPAEKGLSISYADYTDRKQQVYNKKTKPLHVKVFPHHYPFRYHRHIHVPVSDPAQG